MTKTVTRPPQIRLYDDEIVLDGFAGGGGTSTGLETLLGRSPHLAINHDAVALAMHEANHPATRHIQSNIRDVDYRQEVGTWKVGVAWFSPDCTFHSKARGGKPFRDRHRARRVRGLAWEAVRCAEQLGTRRRPRLIVVENVEEFKDWCPLGADGLPDPSRRGQTFRRWVNRLRALGYVVDWKELRACDFGAPTSRKRLFVVARCDGQAIRWPEPTHGPGRSKPYRTAAECIDFSRPVPSIFWNKRQAKAWAKAHGVEAPRRPLRPATLRRIARGIQRFVLDSAEPFIIRYNSEQSDGSVRGQGVNEPLSTVDTANRFALITPFIAPVTHPRDARVHSVEDPLRTITSSERGEFALVTPLLMNNSETRSDRVYPINEPVRTLTAAGCRTFQLVAPTLIQTSYGEREGQAPRVLDLQAPLGTVVAGGIKHSLVAAFLAKHNAGHEATGQRLERPLDAVTTKDSKAIVTSTLVNLRGSTVDHRQTAQDPRTPLKTITASGTHIAEVRAFLVKYFGTKKDGRPVDAPLDTITTKDRYALCTVTIAGETYAIVDIGMRMLTPRELFRAQGFPASYEIDHVDMPTPLGLKLRTRLTKKMQTHLCGNSVPPDLSRSVVGANLMEDRP